MQSQLDFNNSNLSFIDGNIELLINFLSHTESKFLFDTISSNTDWEQGYITLFGKKYKEPRLRKWYGKKPYVYSNSLLQAKSIPDFLNDIKTKIEHYTQEEFNSVLLNLYRDGNDSMGWHQDNEKELGFNPMIASLSLGETRAFHLKSIKNKETLKIPLTSGSLLIMKGDIQNNWKHQIPKTKKNILPRINLTFRRII